MSKIKLSCFHWLPGLWGAWLGFLIDKAEWAHISPGFLPRQFMLKTHTNLLFKWTESLVFQRFSHCNSAPLYLRLQRAKQNIALVFILLKSIISRTQWIFCGWCALRWASAPGTRLRSDTVFTGTARTQSKTLTTYSVNMKPFRSVYAFLYKSICLLYDATPVSILLWYMKSLQSTLTRVVQRSIVVYELSIICTALTV